MNKKNSFWYASKAATIAFCSNIMPHDKQKLSKNFKNFLVKFAFGG